MHPGSPPASGLSPILLVQATRLWRVVSSLGTPTPGCPQKWFLRKSKGGFHKVVSTGQEAYE